MLSGLFMLFALSAVVFGLCLLFLPTVVAAVRHHPNAPTIFLVNLLLGWTFVGWLVALIWASTRPVQQVVYAPLYPAAKRDPLAGQMAFSPHASAALTAARFQGQR